MRILRWLLLASLTSLAAAQFTTVTGTVVDPNGLPYANGTISATLTTSAAPTLSGFSYTPPTQPAALNTSGVFIMQLADNAVLLPAGTKWNFTVCSAAGTIQPAGGTGPICFTLAAPITITGATQSISANLQAVAPALTRNPGTGTVTSVTASPPLSSSGGVTPAISCATCAIGPGASTAGHLAQFSGADGLTLADSGLPALSVAPIFSTPATGISMVTSGTTTVLVGPTTMVTPGVDGTYRFVIQLTQTAPGNAGTCAAGSISVDVAYKDADSGVTYTMGPEAMIALYNMSTGTSSSNATMTNGANARTNNFVSAPREFRAAAGVAVRYEVYQNINSNCTTPPVFAARPALYYMGY